MITYFNFFRLCQNPADNIIQKALGVIMEKLDLRLSIITCVYLSIIKLISYLSLLWNIVLILYKIIKYLSFLQDLLDQFFCKACQKSLNLQIQKLVRTIILFITKYIRVVYYKMMTRRKCSKSKLANVELPQYQMTSYLKISFHVVFEIRNALNL